jgi:putative MATE family efflux protein
MLRDKRESLSEKGKGETFPWIGTALTKDWTKGSILGNLLSLSWPMMMMETLYVVSQIVEMIWIGRLGPSAIAGVGVANIVLFSVMSMDFGFIIGMRAMVARHVGAGNIAGANYIAGQAFVLSVIWGVLITGAGVLLAEPIIRMFGVESQVITEGTAYLRVMFAGWVTMEVLVMGLYVIQSSGDTMTPLKIEFSIRVVHVTLCPFLVKGLWIFPQLGVRGAALSNVISQILGAGLGLWLLFRGHTRLRLTLSHFRFSPNIIWHILKIGVPALVMNLQRSLGDIALTLFIVPFGTLAVAAHSLASRVDMFLSLPGMGLGSGAGVLVGQNLGAHQPERAERGAWLAVGFVEAFMVACSIVILLWAENIIGIFTTEASLIRLGSIFLRIATGSYLILALVFVLQSCIAGAGDTIPNMIINIGMIWVVQLPLAFLLPCITDLGIFGVRWAIVASTFAGTIVYVTYFKLGRWKTKRV